MVIISPSMVSVSPGQGEIPVLIPSHFISSWRSRAVEWSVREGNYGTSGLGVVEKSGLAAVVRAATEGMGLQSILSDFGLCGNVAITSDATAAMWMVRRLGFGKVRHQAVGDLWVQHHVRSGKHSCLKKCLGWRIRAIPKKCE